MFWILCWADCVVLCRRTWKAWTLAVYFAGGPIQSPPRGEAGPSRSNTSGAKTANTTSISEHQQDRVEIVVEGNLVSSRMFQADCPLTVAPMDSCVRRKTTPV